jgi:transposase
MMSHRISIIPPLPDETVSLARAILGSGNFYVQVGEHLATILKDIQADCLLQAGGILPLITFFQFLESLTDLQAINAFSVRLDWKFALHLVVSSPMLEAGALCEFREKILLDPEGQREFQNLIGRLLIFNPPLNDRFQNVDNLQLVVAVCSVNRLNLIHEMICRVLERLVSEFPLWLQEIAIPQWYGRYSYLTPGFDSNVSPYQLEYALQEIDKDIHYLLEEVRRSDFVEIKNLPEIKRLDHIWMQSFEGCDLASNGKWKFLELNGCNFCVLKEGRK